MPTKIILCAIKGISPLLMHSFPLAGTPEGFQNFRPDEQVRYCEYRTPGGQLYIPAISIQRALVNGAAYSKGKGRASLQKPVAACVLVTPEYCVLTPQEYAIDSRPVVIPSTKGRVMRHRPRFNEWSVNFSIEYDPVLLKEAEIRKVVDETGSRVGLLDFRPEKKGPFGRFIVTEWES